MRLAQYLPLASLLAFAATAVAEDSDVISLTPSNFASVVNKEDLILVEFFAPWCGHCKALAPHYEEAATALKEKGIKLAKVDCVDQADLCQEHGVGGYPTLKVFRLGEPTDYTGPRKADGIISYMVKQSLPAVTEVTAENHDEFKIADKLVAILYLSSPTDAPGPEFTAAAEQHRDDYLFGYSVDETVIKNAEVEPPALVLYRGFDEPRIDFKGHIQSVDAGEIETFLKENSVPLMDEVGAENYQVYAQSGLPLAYLFIDPSDESHVAHVDSIRPIAAKHKGKVNFVWIDAIKFGDHAKALNLHEPKWPAFVVQNLQQQLKFPIDQSNEIHADLVDEWVSKFVAGELEPELKSEPIPSSQDEPVYTLVGKTFDEVVFDDAKDVFVEFYAPWCGHCKRLKPTWDSLAERYEGVKDRLVIAKMDATENDLPPSVDFRVSGFPTLKFKPAGEKSFVDYNGDRSLESLIEFVEAQAKNSLVAPSSSSEKIAHAQTPAAHEHHDEL
ncbi:protein disulfide isomerase [Schizopora paradoxa]|uniref:Protein disulfide-isomerase n=1 Tax=Schizopora paradoxa TaxID=27342 RepID=A0A0H2RUI4_9AGAM|nr:protein disulfide isomerase [Schizopora paradoxa]